MTKYALIVVDMQKAYFRNEALAKARTGLVSAINQLVETATGQDIPIFSVVTEHKRDGSTWSLNMLDDGVGYLLEGSDDVEYVDQLNVRSAQKIIKTRDSAFFQTALADKLHELDVETVVICGVSTHSCIAQTAADAYAENFKVVLAGDAIASHDPSYHQVALEMLEQEYRQTVATTHHIIEDMFGESLV